MPEGRLGAQRQNALPVLRAEAARADIQQIHFEFLLKRLLELQSYLARYGMPRIGAPVGVVRCGSVGLSKWFHVYQSSWGAGGVIGSIP
jgi:hypothetical protein